MSIPFYAKSEHNQGYIKNMEVVGFSDLNGINAFQMALYKTEASSTSAIPMCTSPSPPPRSRWPTAC